MTKAEKYFRYLIPYAFFGTSRTKDIVKVNPVTALSRKDADEVFISVYDYNEASFHFHELKNIDECLACKDNGLISWINIDGLRKTDVDSISHQFNIHQLITEDILSVDQRPKMDEVENIFYCLLNMLYWDEITQTVDQEQVSIVLGNGFIITFQED
ncbi:MAG TPA: CorA family divalent cation transporter, partial [Flavisolibacter sp.]